MSTHSNLSLPDAVYLGSWGVIALAWVTGIALKLGACIAGKIFTAFLDQLSWTCGGPFVGAGAGAALGATIGALFIAAVIPGALGSWESDLLPVFGENNDSCLCGGKTPTKCCRFTEANKETCGTKENQKFLCGGSNSKGCFDCYFECYTDAHDRIAGRQLVNNEPAQPCCLGTPSEASRRLKDDDYYSPDYCKHFI